MNDDWDYEYRAEVWPQIADQALGTAVDVLDARGDVETAGLLAFSDLTYKHRGWVDEVVSDYCGVLAVEPALLDFFTDERCGVILETLRAIHRGEEHVRIVEVVAAPRLVEGDWRTERQIRHTGAARGTSSTKSIPALPAPRDGAELTVFNAFRTARSNLAPHDTLVLGMNTRLQLVNGSVVEVDNLVVRRGRMAVVEIDGDTHRRGNRYAADHSRDQLLRDAGVHLERVVAEDMSKPNEVQALVRKVLDRLAVS